MKKLALPAAALLLLTGCSTAPNPQELPALERTPEPAEEVSTGPLGSVADVFELRDAYEDALGTPCSDWSVIGGDDSRMIAHCDDASLGVYGSDDDILEALNTASRVDGSNGDTSELLIGSNWIIFNPAGPVSEVLGGQTVWSNGEPGELPQAQELGKVDGIDELREAYTAAGFECVWDPTPAPMYASASGSCSSTTVLSVFDSTDDLELQAGSLLYISREYDFKTTLVANFNWLINTDEPEAVQAALGGYILTEDDLED